MTTVRTKFHEGDVAKFVNNSDPTDPASGTHVVVVAINPAPLLFKNVEHYRVYAVAIGGDTYATADELYPKSKHYHHNLPQTQA